ncbi:MAG: hypothetical protein U9Q33_13005 [Campylobacterota bacterium]|nr:hypothetical protein [Campylobacterota bacterium]
MRFFILVILLLSSSYALSPFSLEGFKEANVKLFDKNKVLTKQMKKKIKTDLFTQLKSSGIKTKSDNFSNLIVKIEAVKLDENYVVNINFFIVEDVIPSRDKELESLGITYKKGDFFVAESSDLQQEIYDSVIDFILFDFLEQHKEENS